MISIMPNLNRVDSELDLWKQAVDDKVIHSGTDLALTLDGCEYLFPNIYVILKCLLTMPVSTATAERSFSSLRHVKSYLRNTMGDSRLSSLALLNIHKEKDISVEKVLKDFDTTGHRRIALAFK